MHHLYEKGTTVNHSEQSTKILAVLTLALGLALLACSPASAAFTRPFLGQITGTPSGPFQLQPSSPPPYVKRRGPLTLALDGAGDLWVGDEFEEITEEEGKLRGSVPSYPLDEFSPAYAAKPNAFLQTLPVAGGNHIAIASTTTDDFYATSKVNNFNEDEIEVFSPTGAHLETWSGQFREPHIAIDNSTEPLKDPSACGTLPLLSSSECYVYVYVGGFPGARIEKFSSAGVPVEFADAKKCESESCGYIKGNTITGVPSGAGACQGQFSGSYESDSHDMTVDPAGNIYVSYSGCNSVLEYKPNGEYLKDFSLNVRPEGVAFDRISGHLIVSGIGRNGNGEAIGAIEELDATTGQEVSQITETSEGTPLHKPTEMTVDSHGDLYVLDSGAVDAYSSGLYKPTLTLGQAGERKGNSALVSGTVNPEGLKLSQCEFEYVTAETFKKEGFAKASAGECVPGTGAIPVEKKVDTVTAEIKPLIPGTTYYYRLLATSESSEGGTSHTEPLAFTAPAAPGILSTSAANLSSTFADLDGRIDPDGVATSYHFEYLSAASYAADGESFSGPDPAVIVPVPDGSIGSGGPTGGAPQSVMQHIGPLAPGSTYFYRLVAENAQGVTSGGVCEDERGLRAACSFSTLPAVAPGLPDGRSYELVTPATKEGGSDLFALPENDGQFHNEDRGTPSESGDGFLLETKSSFGPFPGAFGSGYVFHREPERGEWTYKSLAPPSLGVQAIFETFFDPADFSRVGVNDTIGSDVAEEGQRTQSLLGEPGGPYTTLHTDPIFHLVGTSVEPHEEGRIVGASRDMSHVVLESEVLGAAGQVRPADHACPGAEGVKHGAALCEWVGGSLKLISVNNEGEPVNACGASLGAGFERGGAHNAVSADGSRVFFTAPQSRERGGVTLSGPGCSNPPQLYARVEVKTSSGEVVGKTLDVSVPAQGVKEEVAGKLVTPREYPALYVGASEDGSKVFFTSEAWLTADHSKVHDLELYACEIIVEGEQPACKLARVSAGEEGEPGGEAGAEVQMVLAVPADGSAIYFTADGVLAPGASPGDCEGLHGLQGSCALYRYQLATASTPAKTTFVAASAPCSFDNAQECSIDADEAGSFLPEPERTRVYATPDGRYLLFKNGTRIYRYDSVGERLTLISSSGEFTRSAPDQTASGALRAMSNDGSYVFFDTADPLVPAATNGTLDVYEWHEGVISLIGSGSEAGPSYFLGYSPYVTPGGETVEGGNVFIGTHAKLVPADTNSVGNIYDARVCVAESPCIQPPPGETAQCEGSSCESTPVEPLDATPTSLTFSGPGDVSSEASPAKAVRKKAVVKCGKGSEKKQGKCVKKPKKKLKAKRSSDKRRAK
jgi:hypothetical protein